MSINPTVFIVAGEPSGDQLGAGLMGALSSATNNRIHFAGIGGETMLSQGLTSLFPMEELSVMGLVEVIPRIPLLSRRIKQTAELIKRLQPAAIVTIDSPGFNFRVVRQLRNINIPIIHYELFFIQYELIVELRSSPSPIHQLPQNCRGK